MCKETWPHPGVSLCSVANVRCWGSLRCRLRFSKQAWAKQVLMLSRVLFLCPKRSSWNGCWLLSRLPDTHVNHYRQAWTSLQTKPTAFTSFTVGREAAKFATYSRLNMKFLERVTYQIWQRIQLVGWRWLFPKPASHWCLSPRCPRS